jgi:hypothetical protein
MKESAKQKAAVSTIRGAPFLQSIFLTREDAARCHASLSKLARHFAEPLVLTGSIAIGWHLLKNGVGREKLRLNDIDVVVEGLGDLSSSLSSDFLILHFHPLRERGKILIMLVDEEHATRIDVFTPASRALITRAIDVAIGEVSCRLVSAEDLLAKLLSIIYPATRGVPVEAKYFENFHLLSTLANPATTGEVWREHRKESQPTDFEEATEAVRLCITVNPALLQASRYCQDINRACSWCSESELFPLAPRNRIYEILGYV